MQLVLTPELLLEAYRQGLFPMAYHAGSPYIHWICPEMRGQLPIETLHIPRRLQKTLRKNPFEITIDTDFESVIRGCAKPAPNRPETWINEPIVKAFLQLHRLGHAHSVECWQGGMLAGGLYGLAVGSAFFAESMFSSCTDSSKIALVHLTARLWRGGFTLLDTQFTNDHLRQFGVYEIPHKDYRLLLKDAARKPADFTLADLSEADILAAYFAFRKNQKL